MPISSPPSPPPGDVDLSGAADAAVSGVPLSPDAPLTQALTQQARLVTVMQARKGGGMGYEVQMHRGSNASWLNARVTCATWCSDGQRWTVIEAQ